MRPGRSGSLPARERGGPAIAGLTSPVARLLAELVRIPSVNPSLERTSRGEGELAGFVASFLRTAGFAVRLEEAAPGRPNVVATLGRPTAEDPALLFECHLDTVPCGGMATGLEPVVRDGRLYGRGACDVKGSLAAMLTALAARAGASRPLVLWAAVDEEHDYLGVRALATSGLPVVGAVVGEPTDLVPVIAHQGNLRLELVARGRAAHTSRPELGESAILHALRLIDLLGEGFASRFAGAGHPLTGPARWSVTQIATDNPVNVIPDRCRLGVDVRLPPGLEGAEVAAWLQATVATSGIPVEARQLREADPALLTDPKAAVVRWAVEAVGAVRGRPVAAAGAPYSTDASKIPAPAVVLGPGDIAVAHTVSEHIALDGLEAAVAVYLGIIDRFLQG